MPPLPPTPFPYVSIRALNDGFHPSANATRAHQANLLYSQRKRRLSNCPSDAQITLFPDTTHLTTRLPNYGSPAMQSIALPGSNLVAVSLSPAPLSDLYAQSRSSNSLT